MIKKYVFIKFYIVCGCFLRIFILKKSSKNNCYVILFFEDLVMIQKEGFQKKNRFSLFVLYFVRI